MPNKKSNALSLTRAALCLALLSGAAAQASTTVIDFNQEPIGAGLVTSVAGSAAWIGYDGRSYDANTNGSDGFLEITPAVNSLSGTVVFPDFDNGAIVQAFKFDCWVRVGNGSSTPADGFSISYARSPLPNPILYNSSTPGNSDAEEGSRTGIAVGFDAYNNGTTPPDPIALDIWVDGVQVSQFPFTTQNGAVTDPTSLQTGPIDSNNPGSYLGLGWAHLVVDLDTNGVLNVYYKDFQILTNFATGYHPSPGQLVMAGRTGGLNENQDVDDITITTTVAELVAAGAATGLPNGVQVTFFDSGTTGISDPNAPATISIDGGPAVPAGVSKTGGTSLVRYISYPTLLVPGSTHTVVATITDTFGRVATSPSLSFTVGGYAVINSNLAASGVNETTPGFRMRTWQSSFEFNINWWAQEQLAGLHGTNQADTTSFTDNGFFDFITGPGPVGVINMDYLGHDDGWFTGNNGYVENLWPGLTPGGNGLTDINHSAADIQCFLKFPAAGAYMMGVDSDDGFKVTVGPNPSDWGALNVGEFNGGRGAGSDTDFVVVVTNAGIYPFRLMWENGTGGANCEWFLVQPNGNRVLINDPDPANDTGVVAYYGGPIPPAFVSWEYPTPGTTLGDPTLVKASITDAGTTVTAGSVQLSVNGTPVVNPTVATANGVTTITGYVIPPLAAGSVATNQLVYSTSGGGPFINTWTDTVATSYPVLNAAWAVTGVDTSKPGFRLRTWQSGNQPGNTQYTEEQLAGLHGDNNVDPSLFTDSVYGQSYMDWADVINLDNGNDGNFQTYDDYPERPWPGLPALNGGLSGSSSMEAITYLYFDHPGLYSMGVNSDDGFKVTAGANPADWLASTKLGEFQGGRGASDTIFSFLVTNAGYYPFRLIWENGAGESGNGYNCEWFTVGSTRAPALINDPRTMGEFGTAPSYYAGPLLPAFVSIAEPFPGSTGNLPNALHVALTDGGTVVDPNSVKLYVNGTQLNDAVLSKSGGVTTATTPASYFLPYGADTAMLVYTTTGTGGGTFTNSWSFSVGGYFLPTWAATGVDVNQPGFRLKPFESRVWPNSNGQPNNNRWTLEQLSGLHGPNAANLTTATDGGFMHFADVVNFRVDAGTGGDAGDFNSGNGYPDAKFPGMTLGTDIPDIGNESIDIVCFLQFAAAGTYTMGVNSDDGFAVFSGVNPSDWTTSQILGQFDGPRGSADTTFTFYVPAPGIYPVRMFWENGNGSASGGNGANCEWFVVVADGTKILLNDPNPPQDPGVKAYFQGPALRAYVSAFCPAAGATGVLPYPAATGLTPNAFGVQLTDGSTTVTPSSIAVTINGTAMTPVVSQSTGTPKVTTVTLPVTSPLPAGANTAQFVYSTAAGSFTNTWSFTVATNPIPVVDAAWAVTGVNTADRGFQYRPWQSPGQTAFNTVAYTEEQLAGLHGPNNADLSVLNDGAYLDYTGLVNFDIGTSHDGDFQPQTAAAFFPNYPDIHFPGIPGANNQTDNSSIEMLTYLQFTQPGVYTMCVNSDDGFKVTVGPNPADWFALNLGQYNGGRGAGGIGGGGGTSFSFVITTAGFYPFRLIWENGNGGCNVEWTVVQPDGSRILINDPAAPQNTAVTAYYKGPALAAGITAVTPTPSSGTGNNLGSLQVKLSDNGTPVTDGSITLTIDGVAVTPTTSKANGITTITYDVLPATNHTATLCYSTSAGGPFCTTWTFTTTAAPNGGVTLPASLWTPLGSGNNQGFAFKVFQSPNTNIYNNWQDNARMADMALQGLYGVNVADLTQFTNEGAMWLPGVINFSSNDPTPATAPAAGNFVTSTWPDALFPGLGVYTNVGGTTPTMNNDAIEAKTFLEFSKAGYYVMGVASDDGFRLTVGDQGSPGKSPLAFLAPANFAGEMTSVYTTTADGDGNRGFGSTPSSTVPIIAHVVIADPIDAQVGGTPTLNNAAAMSGNIALIQRGTTTFTDKCKIAQQSGAVAVIIANNSANDTPANEFPGTMGGTDSAVTVPCLWVNYANGTNIIAIGTTAASSPLIARITAQDCSPIVGGIDIGKGASDVLFGFTVPQPGVYPFRLVWENGGGGASCEWFVRDPALGDFLVGDPAGPVKAWITRDVHFAGALPAPHMNAPAQSGNNVLVSWTGEGELWEAYSPAGPWFKSTFQGNPATVTPNPVAPARFFRVRMY